MPKSSSPRLTLKQFIAEAKRKTPIDLSSLLALLKAKGFEVSTLPYAIQVIRPYEHDSGFVDVVEISIHPDENLISLDVYHGPDNVHTFIGEFPAKTSDEKIFALIQRAFRQTD